MLANGATLGYKKKVLMKNILFLLDLRNSQNWEMILKKWRIRL